MEVDVGDIIAGKYKLVRLLGAGAMGQVWVARHQGLHQTFAIKLMVASIESAEVSLRRFENEAQIAAALSRKTRHIAAVTDYGVEGDVAYLVMELLEGESLDTRIGDGRRLDAGAVSMLVTQLAKGLAVAHAEGVTHRDLKPANIFIGRGEDDAPLVKLLDFGIAQMDRRIVNVKNTARAPTKLTVKGLVLGTPSYMSPEQAMAEKPDARADVWALAVVAFEALAGRTPFDAADADKVIRRICNFQATRLRERVPQASEELEAVFVRAFSKNIEQRFQSATDFATALAAVLPPPTMTIRAAPISSQPPAAASEATRGEVRPRKLAPAIAIGVGVLGALAIAAVVVPRVVAPSPTTTATAQRPSSNPISSTSTPPAITATATTSAIPTVVTNATATTSSTRVRPPASAPATTTGATAATSVPTTAKSVDRSAIF